MEAHWDIPQHELDEYGNLVPAQEWFNLKHAMMSGTGLVKIQGTSAARKKYIQGVAWSVKRLPAVAADEGRLSKDVTRGNELEPFAVAALLRKFPSLPQPRECAFIQLTDHFGFSPDYVDTDLTVGVEIKCFQSESMAEAVFESGCVNGIPKKHWHQALGYFLVPSIKYVMWVVFCPSDEMADGNDFLHVVVLKRQDYEQEIFELKASVKRATTEITKLRESL
jgi:hypothetical protein